MNLRKNDPIVADAHRRDSSTLQQHRIAVDGKKMVKEAIDFQSVIKSNAVLLFFLHFFFAIDQVIFACELTCSICCF